MAINFSSGRFMEIVHYNADGNSGDVAVFFDLNKYIDPSRIMSYKSSDMKYDVVVTLIPLLKSDIKKHVKDSQNIIIKPDYSKKGVSQLTYGNNALSVLNDTPFYEKSIPQLSEEAIPRTKKSQWMIRSRMTVSTWQPSSTATWKPRSGC